MAAGLAASLVEGGCWRGDLREVRFRKGRMGSAGGWRRDSFALPVAA